MRRRRREEEGLYGIQCWELHANFYGTPPVSANVKDLMEVALSCKQLAD